MKEGIRDINKEMAFCGDFGEEWEDWIQQRRMEELSKVRRCEACIGGSIAFYSINSSTTTTASDINQR